MKRRAGKKIRASRRRTGVVLCCVQEEVEEEEAVMLGELDDESKLEIPICWSAEGTKTTKKKKVNGSGPFPSAPDEFPSSGHQTDRLIDDLVIALMDLDDKDTAKNWSIIA